MSSSGRAVATSLAFLVGVALTACVLGEPGTAEGERLGEGSAAVTIATYPNVSGQTLTIEDLGGISVSTVRIASCSDGVLYATRTAPGASTPELWVVRAPGVGAWTKVTAGAKGTKIACDRRHLYSLDANGVLWHASTNSNGQLTGMAGTEWSSAGFSVPAGTTEIGSGLGNVYALVPGSSGSSLWSSALHDLVTTATQGTPASWVLRVGGLGITRVTGTGTLALTSPPPNLSSRPENRVYGVNPDGTLFINDRVLQGVNSWTSVPNGGINGLAVTADLPNVLYSVAGSPLSKRLYRYTFKETSCSDGVDNDANGSTDAEDPACQQSLATSWCATRTGSYCIDRIQATGSFSQLLVTCSGGAAQLTPGVCVKGSLGSDYLKPSSEVYTPEPSDSGHYCSVVDNEGRWDAAWAVGSQSTPCTTLLDNWPSATATPVVVRAGIYSTNAVNEVLVKCTNGAYVTEGVGSAALANAYAAVGHTTNKCVMTASPKTMRVFLTPFPTVTWAPASEPGSRGYAVGHAFDHAPACQPNDSGCPCGSSNINCMFDVTQFGAGGPLPTLRGDFDNRAAFLTPGNAQSSYDFRMNEGTPMLAMGWGRVIPLGSRRRDISGLNLPSSTSFQGEILVKYDIGANPVYRESFVVYYAHVRRARVVDNETVAPFQVIGYSGTSGASSDPHLHLGVFRVTNVNATSGTAPGELAYGWKLTFDANPNDPSGWGANPASVVGAVDPYGWRAPAGIDPYGHYWHGALNNKTNLRGIGAWGPSLWLEDPPY